MNTESRGVQTLRLYCQAIVKSKFHNGKDLHSAGCRALPEFRSGGDEGLMERLLFLFTEDAPAIIETAKEWEAA